MAADQPTELDPASLAFAESLLEAEKSSVVVNERDAYRVFESVSKLESHWFKTWYWEREKVSLAEEVASLISRVPHVSSHNVGLVETAIRTAIFQAKGPDEIKHLLIYAVSTLSDHAVQHHFRQIASFSQNDFINYASVGRMVFGKAMCSFVASATPAQKRALGWKETSATLCKPIPSSMLRLVLGKHNEDENDFLVARILRHAIGVRTGNSFGVDREGVPAGDVVSRLKARALAKYRSQKANKPLFGILTIPEFISAPKTIGILEGKLAERVISNGINLTMRVPEGSPTSLLATLSKNTLFPLSVSWIGNSGSNRWFDLAVGFLLLCWPW